MKNDEYIQYFTKILKRRIKCRENLTLLLCPRPNSSSPQTPTPSHSCHTSMPCLKVMATEYVPESDFFQFVIWCYERKLWETSVEKYVLISCTKSIWNFLCWFSYTVFVKVWMTSVLKKVTMALSNCPFHFQVMLEN